MIENNEFEKQLKKANQIIKNTEGNEANKKIANILNLDSKKEVNSFETLQSSYNISYKAPHNLNDIIKNK